MRHVVLIASALTLSACAGAGGAPVDGPSEYARLAEDCRARGGILTTSGRPPVGRPAVDNICQIRGGSGIPPRN